MTTPRVPCPPPLRSLPHDLRAMSADQWEAWVRWEAEAYMLRELRHRQGVLESQLRHARPDAPMKGIASLQIHLGILAAAVSLQTFGDDGGWLAFKSQFDRLAAERK